MGEKKDPLQDPPAERTNEFSKSSNKMRARDDAFTFTRDRFYETSSRAFSGERHAMKSEVKAVEFQFRLAATPPSVVRAGAGAEDPGEGEEEGAGKGARRTRRNRRDCVRVGRGVSDLGISAGGSFAGHKAVCRT